MRIQMRQTTTYFSLKPGKPTACKLATKGVSPDFLRLLLICVTGVSPLLAQATGGGFRIEEASITDIQNAIKSGQTTCKQVVQAYLARAKAYNGVCTALLTKDGAPIPPSTGMMRAGALLKYPTQTVAASTVFPDLDQYQGLPLEFGQMSRRSRTRRVQLQYGLRVGIPEAGQLDALETLNIRGERSITCKGDFDRRRRPDRCRRVRPRCAKSFASCPMRWNGPPNWTSSTGAIPT